MKARAEGAGQPSLPYLIHRISRLLDKKVNAVSKADGLRTENIRILLRLLERGGDQRVGQLAEATSIEQSALSHMLKRMEAQGLVRRGKVVDHDSRSVIVSLTLRGRRIATKYGPIFRGIDQASLDGVSQAESRVLKQMLIDIYDRLLNNDVASPTASARVRPATPPGITTTIDRSTSRS